MSWLSGFWALGKPASTGHFPYLLLGESPNRQERMGKLSLSHPVENVGLVLAVVDALQETETVLPGLNPSVVARRYIAGIQEAGPLQEEVELYLVVAGYAGMGSPAALVLAAEIVHDEVLELPLEIEGVVEYVQAVAYQPGILHVVNGTATTVIVGEICLIEAVELHRDARQLVSLTLQQEGGHRRVHAAAHGHDYFLLCQIPSSTGLNQPGSKSSPAR